MFLKEVKIKNFRGYGENPSRKDGFFVFSDLDSPFVLLHGFNGHGKTSFFEAIEWCLTDTVTRLTKFYKKDNNGAYSAKELNKSHYLKFSQPNPLQNDRQREVVVELKFDDGFRIERRSFSNVLKISDGSDYCSVLTVFKVGERPRVVNTEELLRWLTFGSIDKTSFYNAHILGQDSIAAFLRNTSPESRKAIFMKLLQQEELSKWIEKLSVYRTPNNTLIKKSAAIGRNLEKINKYKLSIDKYLKHIGYINIEQYIAQFGNAYKKLLPFIRSSHLYPDFNLKLIELEGEITAKECIRISRGAVQLQEKLKFNKDYVEEKRKELNTIQKSIKMIKNLLKAKRWIEKANHAHKLLSYDIEFLKKEDENVEAEIQKLKESQRLTLENEKELFHFNSLFEKLSRFINFKKKNEGDIFWELISQEQLKLEKWNKFVSNNKLSQLSLKEMNFNFIELDWDNERIQKWREKYNSLIKRRDEIKEKIKEHSEKKLRFIHLNEQYMNILIQMKNYIRSNIDKTSSCPVCLNENFSSEKYKKIFRDEKMLSIPESILFLIDRTIANGNLEIEKWIKEEEDLNRDLLHLNKLIEEVLEKPINEWGNLIRKQFLTNYNRYKSHLESIKLDLTDKEELFRQRKRDNTKKWKMINESVKFLFEDKVNIDEINLESVKEIINKKEQWFKENHNQLGFDYIPTLDDIQFRIEKLVNEKNINYYFPDNLEKLQSDIKYNKRTKLYIETLLNQLGEIIRLKIPNEYEEVFDRYEELIYKEIQLKDVQNSISNCIEQVKKEYDRLTSIQTQILGDNLQGHPIIGWVYRTIVPHAYYSDLQIKVDKNGTTFQSKDIRNNLYLDQIFSQAQLNILALSIFLGIGLTQQYSKLNQLFLDDPIQSMDDVNILAFIDVLRAVLDSKKNNKRLIISTHDDNFAELLSIKMRNKNMVQYRIEGYDHEGPVVTRVN